MPLKNILKWSEISVASCLERTTAKKIFTPLIKDFLAGEFIYSHAMKGFSWKELSGSGVEGQHHHMWHPWCNNITQKSMVKLGSNYGVCPNTRLSLQHFWGQSFQVAGGGQEPVKLGDSYPPPPGDENPSFSCPFLHVSMGLWTAFKRLGNRPCLFYIVSPMLVPAYVHVTLNAVTGWWLLPSTCCEMEF